MGSVSLLDLDGLAYGNRLWDFPTTEKRRSNPTAFNTEPSMLPMGGQMKPQTISKILTTR